MLTIRLQRRGHKNDPSFRVIVVESKRAPKTGNYLEMVGSYDARTDRVELKEERIKHWIAQGAQVSDTVHNLLISKKIIEGKKINVLPSFAKTMEGKAAEANPPSPKATEGQGGDNAVAEAPKEAVQ